MNRCEQCSSLAIIACIRCARYCCLDCDADAELKECHGCGHSLDMHGATPETLDRLRLREERPKD